jgi:hypothetical protein
MYSISNNDKEAEHFYKSQGMTKNDEQELEKKASLRYRYATRHNEQREPEEGQHICHDQ